MVEEHQFSERLASSLFGLRRDSFNNLRQPDQLIRDRGKRIAAIGHLHPRYGYRRIHVLLSSEFLGVYNKRVFRLYMNANLAVRRIK